MTQRDLLSGDRYSPIEVCIRKGCAVRDIRKGQRALIVRMEKGEGCVRVDLTFADGRRMSWYCSSPKKLLRQRVRMNDGDPTHTIEFSAVKPIPGQFEL